MRASLLLAATLLAGCAPAFPTAVQPSLDRAAEALDDQLEPAGRIAATAALIAERTGTYPTTVFGLLGDPAAAETGARQIRFSAMTVRPEADGLEIRFTLLPTREDPSRRTTELRLAPPDEGRIEARVLLTRRADPDHDDRALDLHSEDQVAVRALAGRFTVDLTAEPRPEAPARPYTVTFTPAVGPVGAPPREGARTYTVVVGG